MNFKTKIDDFGRLVIPKKIRDDLGISKGTEMSIISKDNEIIIRIDNVDRPFIKDQEGVFVVCSKPTGSLKEAIEKNRDDRIRKILGGILVYEGLDRYLSNSCSIDQFSSRT